MMPENIVFYFPYNRGAGGVNILFLRLSNYLANNTNYDIYIVDYEDGYMVTHNTNDRVRELYLEPNVPLCIPEDSAVILQTIPPWHLPKELEFPLNTRLLFWNLHPYNLLWDFSIDRSTKPLPYRIRTWYSQCLVNRFVSVLVEHHGIVFMNSENLRNTEKITGRSIENPVYLPVPSDEPKKQALTFSNKFAWLGRLANFKISILNYTMTRLSEYSRTRRFGIDFYVIGDGPDRNQVEDAAKSCENEHFKVIFVGEIDFSQLEQFLTNNVSVLFAMGLSALDGARLGMPVVLLDFSYQPLNGDYVFKYLHETEKYTLARDIGTWAYKKGNQSLEKMIDDLRNNYEEIGQLCYEYYKQNHTIDVVATKLLAAIDHCDLRYYDVQSLRRSLTLAIHKLIVRICGLVVRIGKRMVRLFLKRGTGTVRLL